MKLSLVLSFVFLLLLVPITLLLLGMPLTVLLSFPSIIFVFGGSFFASLLAYGYPIAIESLKSFRIVMFDRDLDVVASSEQLIQLSVKARKQGLLHLEQNLQELPDVFLRKGLQLIIDGTDQDIVRDILEAEQNSIIERHSKVHKWWSFIANVSPGFGLTGTILGILATLRNITSNPDLIALGLSTAVITTLFGAFLSNAIALPVFNKLVQKTDDEMQYKQLIIESIVSIQSGENPRFLKERISSFLSGDDKKQLTNVL